MDIRISDYEDYLKAISSLLEKQIQDGLEVIKKQIEIDTYSKNGGSEDDGMDYDRWYDREVLTRE